MSFIKEFKAFAAKGNVIDLAIGVVIGAAFGKIVTALVDDIIMPVVSILTGGMNFSDKFVVMKEGAMAGPYPTLDAAKKAGAAVFAYGHFIQSVVDFLIIALSIFVVLRYLFHYLKKQEVKETTPPPMSTTDTLLTEIRDSLKEKK